MSTGKEQGRGASSEQVVEAVVEALNAQRFQMLKDIALELAGDVVFPTCFDAALRLRKELQNPDLPIERIARIISVEPLITAKLMNMANSVLYSPDGTPARNLVAAINRLGVELTRSTTLAIAMSQLLRARDMAAFSDLTHILWAHSIKSAAATRVLARARTRINPDSALMAGLVHDLGAFYMLYRAVQYPELRASPETVKQLIIEWHESIGVTLLNVLGVPEEIVDATIDHDQPREMPSSVQTLADVVYIGNILAGAHSEWLGQELDPANESAQRVRETYAELMPEIEADAQEMKAVFA